MVCSSRHSSGNDEQHQPDSRRLGTTQKGTREKGVSSFFSPKCPRTNDMVKILLYPGIFTHALLPCCCTSEDPVLGRKIKGCSADRNRGINKATGCLIVYVTFGMLDVLDYSFLTWRHWHKPSCPLLSLALMPNCGHRQTEDISNPVKREPIHTRANVADLQAFVLRSY